MLKYFTFIPLLLSLSIYCDHKLQKTYYPNGALKEQYYCFIDKNGNQYWDGKYTKWFENGHKAGEGNLKRHLSSDITVGITGIIRSGREGHWTFWYPNGQKQAEFNYTNGECEGFFIEYYENGNKKVIGKYLHGLNNDVWEGWDKKGLIKFICKYKNGKFDSLLTMYENGKRTLDCNFINGIKNGPLILYYNNGNPKMLLTIKDDTLDGDVISCNENGEKTYQGQMKDGKLIKSTLDSNLYNISSQKLGDKLFTGTD